MGIKLISKYFLFFFILISCERHRPKTNRNIIPDKNVVVEQPIQSNQPKSFIAKVIRIIDGDTMEVLYGELPIKLRLAHIDCPEKRGKQPYGNAAKQALSDLCFAQNVKIEWSSKDRNGRYISVIYNNAGQNVNQEMVKMGMAWHYKKYSNEKIYSELENKAKADKIGLWQDPNPIAPWDWRK